ncbi:PREDICTED: uncharacterized protein LOC105954835 [Erythranthe guttata]|uniref:uncharacterized protein LOC105954835 n=1 Tax=Erythranthe guttata TaxID=4155 RepID=UPI00064D9198|nr:PREDICTED: uncharacterized protein LOC105954835 [Erythranthe guttata]|eukprot:XP_012833979.1 PREDICTED: uncharacterized protein LOC105954835 [Erythranthe guttata]
MDDEDVGVMMDYVEKFSIDEVFVKVTLKDGLFPIAFAIVNEENDDNWDWFLALLKQAINDDRVFTFISDRQHGIRVGVKKVFPDSFHSSCLRHMTGNLNNKFKGVPTGYREAIVSQFISCAFEFSKTSFDKKIEKLKASGSTTIVNFLNDLPYHNWANAYFEGQRYGEMYSNGVESWNSKILDYRDLPVMTMIDTIRSELMKWMTSKRDKSSKWSTICCPNYEKSLGDLELECRTWKAEKAANGIYEVLSDPSMVVDLSRKTCTCRKWQILGFPCVHAVYVLVNETSQPYDYIDKLYYAEYYRECYASPIYPFVRHSSRDDEVCVCPPEFETRRGRPKKKRIPSVGEKIKRKIRCGRCKELGNHNKKSCTNPMYS